MFGTGAIGFALIHELDQMGLRVRAVNRSGHADVHNGIEMIAGDASDRDFAAQAGKDATAVYQCLDPAYHQWACGCRKVEICAMRRWWRSC